MCSNVNIHKATVPYPTTQVKFLPFYNTMLLSTRLTLCIRVQESKNARRPSVGLLQNLLCLGDKDDQLQTPLAPTSRTPLVPGGTPSVPFPSASDVTKLASSPGGAWSQGCSASMVTLFHELCACVTLLSKYLNEMAVR